MNKQPEKTAQTKSNIIDAFWIVVNNRGLNNVTIGEITKTANLNRGTFYVYFTDVNDILNQAEQLIIDDFCIKLLNAMEQSDVNNFQIVTQKIIELIGNYDDKLFILIGKDGDPNFLNKLREQAIPIFQSLLNISEDKYYMNYIIVFMSSAFAGLLQYWHETRKEIPLSTLATIGHELAFHGMSRICEEPWKGI